MRSRALAIGAAAVLGIACGVVTAFALPRHVADPLNLGVALVDQPCKPGQSVVMVGWGRPSSGLASAVASNPGARYLEPARSCGTTWRYQPPGETTARPDPEYVVYLGPYDTRRACGIRMEGSHKGSFVTTLSAGTTDMVQCVCYVDVATAPTLRTGMTIDATDSIWIRQLQQMLSDAHLLPGVTGDYDQATQDAIRTEQAKVFPQPSGTVDTATWQYLTRSLCRRYTY